MNISLEEQIEYMRELLIFSGEYGNDVEANKCRAILATLEAIRDERNAKVTP